MGDNWQKRQHQSLYDMLVTRCRLIYLFIGTEKIWINLALHHLLTNRSSALNGCHQKRVQQLIKNITIIHRLTPVNKYVALWSEAMSWWICFLQAHSFSLHTTLTYGLESCALLVYCYYGCISSLNSHSDGTHSLQRIQWTSGVKLHFSKSV